MRILDTENEDRAHDTLIKIDVDAVPTLTKAVQDKNHPSRLTITDILGEIGRFLSDNSQGDIADSLIVPALREVSSECDNEESRTLREQAANALYKINTKESMTASNEYNKNENLKRHVEDKMQEWEDEDSDIPLI